MPLVVTLDGERGGSISDHDSHRFVPELFGHFGDWKNKRRLPTDCTRRLWGGRSECGDGRGNWIDHWIIGKHQDD